MSLAGKNILNLDFVKNALNIREKIIFIFNQTLGLVVIIQKNTRREEKIEEEKKY